MIPVLDTEPRTRCTSLAIFVILIGATKHLVLLCVSHSIFVRWRVAQDKDAAAAAKIRAKLEALEGYDMESGQTKEAKRAKKAAILDGEAARKRKEKSWFKNPLAKQQQQAGGAVKNAKVDAIKRGKKATRKAKKEAAKFALAMR